MSPVYDAPIRNGAARPGLRFVYTVFNSKPRIYEVHASTQQGGAALQTGVDVARDLERVQNPVFPEYCTGKIASNLGVVSSF